MALTKADIVDHLFEELGISNSEAKDLVARFFAAICASLERGEEVNLSGFGNFESAPGELDRGAFMMT